MFTHSSITRRQIASKRYLIPSARSVRGGLFTFMYYVGVVTSLTECTFYSTI
jgi:hypothetical protein